MNTSDEKNSVVEPEEELFVRRALAKVEKAERFSRIRHIALSVIALPAVYFLINTTPLQPGMPLIVMMVVGLMLAVCTAKILALINKNTLAILRAVADVTKAMQR
jgi:hypothetical protein